MGTVVGIFVLLSGLFIRNNDTIVLANTWVEKHLTKTWAPYPIIGLISILVWGRTIRFDFVWDDHLFVTKNTSIRSLKNIPRMFYSLKAQASESAPLFRPLRTAHFAILAAIPGKSIPQPWIFHFANVLWHSAAAMLFFAVALVLFQRQSGGTSQPARTLALLISIGFAVHPVTSEVVCWAKSLDDIMATVFVLAATRSLLKWTDGDRGCFRSLIYFLLAVYSKESAVPFAVLVFFIAHGFHKLSVRRSIMMTMPFMLIAFAYLVHRRLVIGSSSQGPPLSGSYGQTLVDMSPVLIKYFRLLWGIPPFSIDYSYMQGHHGLLSGEVLEGAIILLLYAGMTMWALRQQGHWLAGFGFLWLGLFLTPVSNLVPMMQYMAERFLYLPLIGFLLVLGAILLSVSKSKPTSSPARPFQLSLASTVVGILVLIWTPLSWNRSEVWRDELTLFVRSSLEHPRSLRIEKNALVAIFRLPHMRALFPDYLETDTLNMADAISPRDAKPVIDTLTEAHRLFPESELITTSLGLTYAKIGQYLEAIPLLESSTRQYPNQPPCWINLAMVLMSNGDRLSAREACETALRLAPTNVDALRIEFKLCSDLKDYKAALVYAERLQELEPENQVHKNRVEQMRKKLEAENQKLNAR